MIDEPAKSEATSEAPPPCTRDTTPIVIQPPGGRNARGEPRKRTYSERLSQERMEEIAKDFIASGLTASAYGKTHGMSKGQWSRMKRVAQTLKLDDISEEMLRGSELDPVEVRKRVMLVISVGERAFSAVQRAGLRSVEYLESIQHVELNRLRPKQLRMRTMALNDISKTTKLLKPLLETSVFDMPLVTAGEAGGKDGADRAGPGELDGPAEPGGPTFTEDGQIL